MSSTRAVPLNPEEVSVIRILRDIAAKYGIVALVVYLVIHATVFGTAYFAIRAGWTPNSVVGGLGAATMAYVVVKILQPLRIAATVVITPFVTRFLERIFPRLKPVAAEVVTTRQPK